jgi:hypothetical protein
MEINSYYTHHFADICFTLATEYTFLLLENIDKNSVCFDVIESTFNSIKFQFVDKIGQVQGLKDMELLKLLAFAISGIEVEI